MPHTHASIQWQELIFGSGHNTSHKKQIADQSVVNFDCTYPLAYTDALTSILRKDKNMNTCTFVLVSVLSVGVYAQENSSPCTIHPNGAALDHVPFAAYEDHTTCAEFIELKTCTFVLVSVLAVGVYAQENSSPCTICPNGAA